MGRKIREFSKERCLFRKSLPSRLCSLLTWSWRWRWRKLFTADKGVVLFSLTTTRSQVRIRAMKSATPTTLTTRAPESCETPGLQLRFEALPRKLLVMRLQDSQLLPCDCTSLAKKNPGTKVLKNDLPTAETRCDTSSEVKLCNLRYAIVMRSIHSDRTRLTCQSISQSVQTMKLDLLASQFFFWHFLGAALALPESWEEDWRKPDPKTKNVMWKGASYWDAGSWVSEP